MRVAGVWGPKDKDEEDKKASPPINLTTEHIIIVIMKYPEAVFSLAWPGEGRP